MSSVRLRNLHRFAEPTQLCSCPPLHCLSRSGGEISAGRANSVQALLAIAAVGLLDHLAAVCRKIRPFSPIARWTFSQVLDFGIFGIQDFSQVLGILPPMHKSRIKRHRNPEEGGELIYP